MVAGEFSPGAGTPEWCDAEVLRLLRRRSLAALRREIEPVPPRVLARFLPAWQGVTWLAGSAGHHRGEVRGVEAVAAAVEQLQGVAVPASALERLILPTRVGDYAPSYLDELCASGEVMWAGSGGIAAGRNAGDGWITLAYADAAPLLLPTAQPEAIGSPVHEAVLDALDDGQALFFRALSARLDAPDDAVLAALWELVWGGHISNDTLAPVRALLGGGGGAHRSRPSAPRSRLRRPGRRPGGLATGTPGVAPRAAGRWYRLPPRDTDPTHRAAALAEQLLERHGILTRGAVAAEDVVGGFAGVYPVLAALEERGAARRGYFVEGLGAAQFAPPGAVDRLRALADAPPAGALVLAATDPANPYGAALPWPERAVDELAAGHRAGRRAGALVVLVDGELVLYVERGGRTLLSYVDDAVILAASAKALADAVHTGALGAMSVERADGEAIHASPVREALTAAGFRLTPRGLRLRG
jgi:ATP-dependent Lhr-like helicase